jgi:hypothetical protein
MRFIPTAAIAAKVRGSIDLLAKRSHAVNSNAGGELRAA